MSIIEKALKRSEVIITKYGAPESEDKLFSIKSKKSNKKKAQREEIEYLSSQKTNNLQGIRPVADKMKSIALLNSDGMASELIDDYRRIKRPLLANAFGKSAVEIEKGNLILITSSVPGEGKTFTALNLALSIALEKDRTVLLVDADVIKQGLTENLNLKERKGLIDVLDNENIGLKDVLVRTDIANFGFLPSGGKHEHATELLASKKMSALVGQLATRYSDRVIIFDSPPLLASPLSYVLADLVGQLVLVIESGKTPTPVVEQALESLDKDKVVGVLLNKGWQSYKHYLYYAYS